MNNKERSLRERLMAGVFAMFGSSSAVKRAPKAYRPRNSMMDRLNPFKKSGAELPITRQMERSQLRAEAFKEINRQFFGEDRDIRRAMAMDKGNRDYRNRHGLPEPRPELVEAETN